MGNTNFHPAHVRVDTAQPNEAAVEKLAPVDHEGASIAAGMAELAAGRGIGLDDLESWLRARRIDPNVPLPAGSTPFR